MEDKLSIIQAILEELDQLSEVEPPYPDSDGKPELPRQIYVGEGRVLHLNDKADHLISDFALLFRNDNVRLDEKFTRDEWIRLVRALFGPAIASNNDSGSIADRAGRVLGHVTAAIEAKLAGYGYQEFYFGCTLSNHDGVPAISLGPVQIENRLDWLGRKYNDGDISRTTKRRVERAWGGENLRRRKSHREMHQENGILDAVGGCGYIISVGSDGLAPGAALERSLMVARISMAVVSLAWPWPSRALNGINLAYDRKPYQRRTLRSVPNASQLLITSSLRDLPPPWLSKAGWERLLHDFASQLSVAGEVFGFILSDVGEVKRKEVMDALTHALLWFHEACREEVPSIATVKFAASMDALAKGGKANGICKLMRKQFEINDNYEIRPGGRSMRSAVKAIYNEGRSRMIHGNSERLNRDWMEDRMDAEQLARHCLLACMEWAADNPDCGDVKAMSE